MTFLCLIFFGWGGVCAPTPEYRYNGKAAHTTVSLSPCLQPAVLGNGSCPKLGLAVVIYIWDTNLALRHFIFFSSLEVNYGRLLRDETRHCCLWNISLCFSKIKCVYYESKFGAQRFYSQTNSLDERDVQLEILMVAKEIPHTQKKE